MIVRSIDIHAPPIAPPKLPGPHKEAAMEAALADFMADWSPN